MDDPKGLRHIQYANIRLKELLQRRIHETIETLHEPLPQAETLYTVVWDGIVARGLIPKMATPAAMAAAQAVVNNIVSDRYIVPVVTGGATVSPDRVNASSALPTTTGVTQGQPTEMQVTRFIPVEFGSYTTPQLDALVAVSKAGSEAIVARADADKRNADIEIEREHTEQERERTEQLKLKLQLASLPAAEPKRRAVADEVGPSQKKARIESGTCEPAAKRTWRNKMSLTHAVYETAPAPHRTAPDDEGAVASEWTFPVVVGRVTDYTLKHLKGTPGVEMLPFKKNTVIVYMKPDSILGTPLVTNIWQWIVARNTPVQPQQRNEQPVVPPPIPAEDEVGELSPPPPPPALSEDEVAVDGPAVVTDNNAAEAPAECLDLVVHFRCVDGDARYKRLMDWPVPPSLDREVVFKTVLVRKCAHRAAWMSATHPFLAALGAWLDGPEGSAPPVYTPSPAPVGPGPFPGTGALTDTDPWTGFIATTMSADAKRAFLHAAAAYTKGIGDVAAPLSAPMGAEYLWYVQRVSAPFGWMTFKEMGIAFDWGRYGIDRDVSLVPQIAGQLWRASNRVTRMESIRETQTSPKRYNIREACDAFRRAGIIVAALVKGGCNRQWLINKLSANASV